MRPKGSSRVDRVSARSRGSCQSNRPWVHPSTAYMWTHIQAQPLKGEVTEACFIHSLIHSTSTHWASPGTGIQTNDKKRGVHTAGLYTLEIPG